MSWVCTILKSENISFAGFFISNRLHKLYVQDVQVLECLCHMRFVIYSASLHSRYAGYLADRYSNLWHKSQN